MSKNKKKLKKKQNKVSGNINNKPTEDDLAKAIQFHKSGNIQEAERIYLNILKKNPGHSDALHLQGLIFHQSGKDDLAISYISKAISVNPEIHFFHNNLGAVFKSNGRLDDAICCFQKALQLLPDFVEAQNNLGNSYKEQGKFELAIECYQKAIQKNPNYAEAYNNMGNSLKEVGRHDSSIKCYKKALELKPDYAEAHFNYGISLLLTMELERGWCEYEWRSGIAGMTNEFEHVAKWDGSDIAGKSILIQAEQGLGDTIQFVRYIPLVKRKGARVIFACPKELMNLLKEFEGIDLLVENKSVYGPSPIFDFYINLLSLPGVFKTNVNEIPADIPYIKSDEKLSTDLTEKVDPQCLNVGLAWAGNPKNVFDEHRSCKLADFKTLTSISGIRFFSLQKGAACKQIESIPKDMTIINLEDQLNDFTDTAAIIRNLDLVISVDTVVAHLTGALGRPIWNLIHFSPHWPWMLEKEETPWYPTMRLFRQPEIGDWESVINRLKVELEKLVEHN